MQFKCGKGTKKVRGMILLAAGVLVAMPMARDAEAVVSKAFVTVGLTPSFTGVGSIFFLLDNTNSSTYADSTLLNQAATPGAVPISIVKDSNTLSYLWVDFGGINTTALPLFGFEYSFTAGDPLPVFSVVMDQGLGTGIKDTDDKTISASESSFVLTTCYFSDTQAPVAATVTGAGTGTVTSVPVGIACVAGTCMSGFEKGSQVTLIAVPSADSYFKSWTGACTGTGDCVIASLDAVKSVGAEFAKYQAIRIAGTTSYFDTVQDAYNAATTGAVLEAMATTSTSLGPLTMNAAKTITLKGGYNGDYTPSTTLTTTVGTITVAAGTLIAQNIVVN